MAEKICKLGIPVEKDYLYFVDKEGDVSRTRDNGLTQEKVAKAGIKKQPGYLYFIDKDGDVCCVKIAIEK